VWAMVAKEFRELRRDRRTVAMMIVMPAVLLVVFGYAANFRVRDIPTVVVGPAAAQAAPLLPAAASRLPVPGCVTARRSSRW
jgi:ABC-2 type transport system permease protein